MTVVDTIIAIIVAIGGRELLAAGVPKAIDAWRSSRKAGADVEIARERRAEREASQRIEIHRAHVEETGIAARIVERAAEDVRAEREDHARERSEHAKCREEVAEARAETAAERAAGRALERVIAWLLERLDRLDDGGDEPPPTDVAETLRTIRPSMEPAE